MSDSITLPLSPHELGFWSLALGLAVVSALLFGALSLVQERRKRPVWDEISAGWLAILVPLVMLWLAVFLMIIAAVMFGAWRAIHDPTLATLGLGGLIAAILGAPFLIWSTILKHQTVRYQKEGHMTDRIAKAVEQLGAEKTVKREGKEETQPNLEVRMGAILSLERIAQDSTTHDKGRDHVMVMQILCEYIRENSNARKPQEHDLGEWEPLEDDATTEERKAYLRTLSERSEAMSQWAVSIPKPRADVQLALKVIGRRSALQRLVEAAWPNPPDTSTRWPFDPDFKCLPDVRGQTATTIEQIEIFRAGLEAWKKSCEDYRGYRLDLRGANLQAADMAAGQPDGSDAVFSGAKLEGARIEGASLDRARIEGARLDEVRMDSATFDEARMEGARLDWARAEAASLNWARMEGASLHAVRMQSANLYGARMTCVNFTEALFQGAALYRVRLEGATLYQTQLEGVSLQNAQMDGVVLRKASLSGAFSTTEKQLFETFGDASNLLPQGLVGPAHWPSQKLGWRDFHTELAKWRASPSTYTPPEEA